MYLCSGTHSSFVCSSSRNRPCRSTQTLHSPEGHWEVTDLHSLTWLLDIYTKRQQEKETQKKSLRGFKLQMIICKMIICRNVSIIPNRIEEISLMGAPTVTFDLPNWISSSLSPTGRLHNIWTEFLLQIFFSLESSTLGLGDLDLWPMTSNIAMSLS